MSQSALTADQVLVDPQLAVLHALEATLGAATWALLAAHAELEEEDLCGERPLVLDAEGWIAEGMLRLISALEDSIRRYHAEIARARARVASDSL